MKLDEMLNEQYDFQRLYAFNPDHLTMDERERWLERFVTHTNDQALSVLNELNWKEHEPNEPVDYDQAAQEIVDTLKYVLNMAVVLNVSPEELEAEFRRRSQEVRNRQEHYSGDVGLTRCPSCSTDNIQTHTYEPKGEDTPDEKLVIDCNECDKSYELEI